MSLFLAGLALSSFLIMALILEIFELVRPIFGCLFLAGVIGLFVFAGFIGILLSPWLILGALLNIVIFSLVSAAGGGNNGKKRG